jgi:hypothetical protein
MNKDKFQKVTTLVIDKLEGGYYHPNMLVDGRIKDSRYGASGETMFGIDRLNGGAINRSRNGLAFWSIIDKAGASTKWAWNFTGGALKPALQKLASNMIYALYSVYIKLYLKSPSLIRIIENDDRLLFHFVYATWNGAGWFKKFATDMFNAYKSGIKNPNDLYRVAIASRTKEGLRKGTQANSLIKQGGEKIASLFKDYKPSNTPMVLYGVLGLILAYYFVK